MPDPIPAESLEQQIGAWRSYLRRRQAIQPTDVAELEHQLRGHLAALGAAGLTPDEAFLVAVKRIGSLDALSQEFAREHSDRLWKQPGVVRPDSGESDGRARTDAIVAFCLAVAAGSLVKLPGLFGIQMGQMRPEPGLSVFGIQMHQDPSFYFRNSSLFVLPLLTVYFAWKRRLSTRVFPWLAAAFVGAGGFANAHRFVPGGALEVLTVLHLPIALWLAVGIAYAGGRWGQVGSRMGFIRFSGELFIYYALIALGGGVLTGFSAMIFQAIGVQIDVFLEAWLPSCVAGAVLIAARLVEAKQGVIENMAPVLTRVFTPLFTVALLAFLGTLFWTGRGFDLGREVIMAFDVLLLLVLGLLLYSVSARDPRSPAGVFDVLQVVLVTSALVANAVALWAIAARISDFGFTPNRVAALGENLILLVNLAWSAVLYLRFLTKRGAFTALEKWQTDYLPVYSAWAAIVVIVFPLVFK